MADGKKLTLPGVDTEAGLHHIGGDFAMYLHFLRQFPQDDSVSQLERALAHGEIREAFLCAHTLKGLAAQLGIDALRAPAEEICELLRAQDPASLPQARAVFSRLRRRHARLLRSLKSL